MEPTPLISIIMPVRNEAASLHQAYAAIAAQSYPSDRLEILIVDGGSRDGTIALAERLMANDGRVSLLGGPSVNTPLAMQLGIQAASGEIIAKVDGHGWVNDRFVESAVRTLMNDGGVGCVGGPIRPVAQTEVERAIALARFSVLGVGGGVYTLEERGQDVQTVQCGVYRREALTQAGGFDPELPFGEDEEVNFRIRQAGWRIRFDPAMHFYYRVRPSVGSLFRQYFRYGRARVAVIRKHPSFLHPKHAIPAGLIIALSLSLLISLTWRIWPLAIVVWAGYLGIVGAGAGFLATRARFRRPDLVALALIALHLGYGLGSLRGLADSQGGPHGGKGPSGAGT